MDKTKIDKKKLEILTTEFRLSHPHLFKPSQMMVKGQPQGKLQYSIEMLFDKKTTEVSLLQAPMKYAIQAEWGPDKSKWPKPMQLPIRDGDKPYGSKKEVKKEHKGMWVVKATALAEYQKPYVVGRDPEVNITEESQVYPGCYCRAALKAHPYTFADKNGVKFILEGVQFIRDGEAFGGRKPANQLFGVVEGDEGDADLVGNSDTDSEAEGEEAFGV